MEGGSKPQKRNIGCTLLPATFVLTEHKLIGREWMYKIEADNSYKRRLVVLGWGQLSDVGCCSIFAPHLQAP